MFADHTFFFTFSHSKLVRQQKCKAPECTRVNKRLAEKIAEKRREPYASVITYIRTKLRFALLRSTLAAVRGFRGKRSDGHLQDLTDIDFSLIPRPTVT